MATEPRESSPARPPSINPLVLPLLQVAARVQQSEVGHTGGGKRGGEGGVYEREQESLAKSLKSLQAEEGLLHRPAGRQAQFDSSSNRYSID